MEGLKRPLLLIWGQSENSIVIESPLMSCLCLGQSERNDIIYEEIWICHDNNAGCPGYFYVFYCLYNGVKTLAFRRNL